MGCTASVKWTGLGFVATVGVVQLARTWLAFTSLLPLEDDLTASPEDMKKTTTAATTTKTTGTPPLNMLWMWGIIAGVTMLAVLAVVYLSTWVVHFSILTNSGPGDIWHGQRFLATLSGAKKESVEGVAVQPYTMWEKIVEVHKLMFEANNNLQTRHAFGSSWHDWPMMQKPISYWVGRHPRSPSQGGVITNPKVTLDGNAMVFGFTTTVTLIMSIYLFITWLRWDDESLPERQRTFCRWGTWLFFGYAINILPYVLVTRVCFLYHYVPSLLFAMLLSGLAVDKYLPPLERWLVVGGAILGCAYFFTVNAAAYYAT